MDVLDVAGAPRERGRAHSEALRERIAVGLEFWREHARPAGRTEHYVDTARRWTPATVEELEGIAEGAAAPFPAVVAYNLGDELRVFGALERCTSAGLQRNGLGLDHLAAARAPLEGPRYREVMEAVGPAVVAGATAHVTHLRRPA